MMMIVLRLLSRLLPLLGLKSLSHRHFSPRPLKVFFEGGGRGVAGFEDSGGKTLVPSASNRSTPEWTLVDSGPETLVPSASNRSTRVDSLWTPWAPATGEPTTSDFALVVAQRLGRGLVGPAAGIDHHAVLVARDVACD